MFCDHSNVNVPQNCEKNHLRKNKWLQYIILVQTYMFLCVAELNYKRINLLNSPSGEHFKHKVKFSENEPNFSDIYSKDIYFLQFPDH